MTLEEPNSTTLETRSNFATYNFEEQLWKQGYRYIAGIDEVGRGSWAGPVVAAAVILPIKKFQGLKDSKLLNPTQRETFSKIIIKEAVAVGIGEIGLSFINKEGIGKATQRAFRQSLKQLKVRPDFFIIDAFYIRYLSRKRQLPIKDGDKLSVSIAAASIVAKVFRDNLMTKLHLDYPHYGFATHKGYGTKLHQEMIKRHGLSAVHRKSFNLKFLFHGTSQ